MSKNTVVHPWWRVASDIAEGKGWGDAALEELTKSQWQKRNLHGEDAVDETGGFIDLDECKRDPVQVAAEAKINDDIYRALKGGRLQAYYPDSRPMTVDDVLDSGMRLEGVCVEPVRVNALLETYGHPPGAWVPEGAEQNQGEAISLPGKILHKQRGNSLDIAIDKAIKKAGCDEMAAVYMALHELALNGDALPFTGTREGHSLGYTNDNDELVYLTKNALGKRLGRLRNKAA